MSLKKLTINKSEFEDILFSDDKIVVQKDRTFGKNEHITSLYVFEENSDKTPKFIYERIISGDSTEYFKHSHKGQPHD